VTPPPCDRRRRTRLAPVDPRPRDRTPRPGDHSTARRWWRAPWQATPGFVPADEHAETELQSSGAARDCRGRGNRAERSPARPLREPDRVPAVGFERVDDRPEVRGVERRSDSSAEPEADFNLQRETSRSILVVAPWVAGAQDPKEVFQPRRGILRGEKVKQRAGEQVPNPLPFRRTKMGSSVTPKLFR
jgi:hypothetical protein